MSADFLTGFDDGTASIVGKLGNHRTKIMCSMVKTLDVFLLFYAISHFNSFRFGVLFDDCVNKQRIIPRLRLFLSV